MARPSRYSPEVRARAIRLVQEHGPECPSQWAAIGSIASKFGCTAEGIVKLTKNSSIDPKILGLQSVANQPCWASRTAVSLNLNNTDGRPSRIRTHG